MATRTGDLMSGVAPLSRWQDQMSRLFETFFEDMPQLRPYGEMFPAINLWEEGDDSYIEAELPGLTMNDIEVLVMGNEVTITGDRKIEAPQQATFHRRERAHGRFSRTVVLPWEIDADKVEAKFHDGILTVRLPKSENAKPKKVQVQAA